MMEISGMYDMTKKCTKCSKEYAGSLQSKYCFSCAHEVRLENQRIQYAKRLEKKRVEEMLKSGKTPICIGQKTGGHW
ncbi:MAG: hypothetical protein M0P59_13460 [Gallionella sp.]|jgi:hypothetical protein|nr:hypothetical protein [Gallionella sp.]